MNMRDLAFALSPLLIIPTAFIVTSAVLAVAALAAGVTWAAMAITLMVAASWVDVRRL